MLFFVDIPIKITSAIWEKIFIELFKNKTNTKPPNTASGTVIIIINGCINELKVAAITKYAVYKASANIIYNSFVVSFNSSDFPFQVICFSGATSCIVFSKNLIASARE